MGGVALVVVYDFGGGCLGEDSGVESYVHRIGRTGRAEKTGKALTFFTESDSGAAKLVELLKGAKQKVPSDQQALADKDSRGRGRSGAWNGDKRAKGGKCGKGKSYSSNGKGKGGKGKGHKGGRW